MKTTKRFTLGGLHRGFVFGLIVFAVLAIVDPQTRAYAQSATRNNPTQLRSKEIRGFSNSPIPGDGSWGTVFYYTFTAGPGEMTATVITKPRGDRVQYNISFEEPDGSRIGETLGLLGGGATERRISKNYSFARPTRVIMTIKVSGSFDYRILLDGALDLPRPAGITDGGGSGIQDEEGPIMRLPNRGTLLIRMKDGSTREIDLSLVKEMKILDR